MAINFDDKGTVRVVDGVLLHYVGGPDAGAGTQNR